MIHELRGKEKYEISPENKNAVYSFFFILNYTRFTCKFHGIGAYNLLLHVANRTNPSTLQVMMLARPVTMEIVCFIGILLKNGCAMWLLLSYHNKNFSIL